MTVYQQSSFMDLLASGARLLDLSLPKTALPIFERYNQYLSSWNLRLNLTSLTKAPDIAVLHFLDSLTVLKVLPPGVSSLLDVGTGPGFPGLVLKIARPGLSLWLLDTDPKKIVFLKQLVAYLGISNVRFLSSPILELPLQAFKSAFDAVVARALALPSLYLSKISLFLKPSAVLIRMLGPGSLMGSLDIAGFMPVAYWSGYLPFLPVYRRLVALAPSSSSDHTEQPSDRH